MRHFLLAVLIALPLAMASVVHGSSDDGSSSECYPGGWPLMILPVEVGADIYNLPFPANMLQEQLTRSLLEYSPFTHIESEVSEGQVTPGPGWFYLRAEVTGRSGTGYDVKADREFNLRVTIWAGGDLSHVFQRQYKAVHETSRPTEGFRSPGHSSAGTATSHHVIVQWTSALLPDLIDFFGQGVWEYATAHWKARHGDRPLLIILLPNTAGFSGDEEIWRIVAKTLSNRGCAQVDMVRSDSTNGQVDSAFARKGPIAGADQYFLQAQSQGEADGLSLSWQLERWNTHEVVLEGTTKPATQRWQLINSARALAARVGTYLHPVVGISTVE